MRFVPGLAVIFVSLLLTACKLEITVPPEGRVVSQNYACKAGSVCIIDVAEKTFDETFRGIPGSDPYTFTGWKSGYRHFCSNSTGPCRLFTTTFGDNEVLQAILDSTEEKFYLAPKFEEISDNLESGAKAFIPGSETILRGLLGGPRVSYDSNFYLDVPVDESDYLVFVAPANGAVTLKLDEMTADLDLSLETTTDIIDLSNQVGTEPEFISAQVSAGNTYSINVYSFDSTRTSYRLTVNYKPFQAPDTPGIIPGNYEIKPGPAFGFCASGEIFFSIIAPSVFHVQKDGQFTEYLDGQPSEDDLLVFRKYVNDPANGTFTRSEVFKAYSDSGGLAMVLERLVTGNLIEGLQGERIERIVELSSDGTKSSDCISTWSFSGVRVANQ